MPSSSPTTGRLQEPNRAKNAQPKNARHLPVHSSHPSPSQATSAAAADAGGVFPPPPPAPAYQLSASGSSELSYYHGLRYSPRSPLPVADAAASAPPTPTSSEDFKETTWALYFPPPKGGARHGVSVAGGGRWRSSAATVDGKGVARAGFIPAPEAAAFSPGPPSAVNCTPYFPLHKDGARQGAPVAGGDRWRSSAATVDGKGFARAGFIPAPDAAASSPGPSGSTAHIGWALSWQDEEGQPSSSTSRSASSIGWALSSQAEAGQPSSCTSPRSASSIGWALSSQAEAGQPSSCTSPRSASSSSYVPNWASAEEEILRGPISPETDPSSVGQPHIGSSYWDQYPVTEDLNPADFSSRHPLFEGFAIPANVAGKRGFKCVYCDKKLVGSADKGVNHMLKNKGCLIPDVHKQSLKEKVNAYRLRKQDLLKRKRGKQI